MNIATSIRIARGTDHAQLQSLFADLDRAHRDGAPWLLREAERWALERNAAWVEVNVYQFNMAAYEFYTSVGFETTMRRMRKPLAG